MMTSRKSHIHYIPTGNTMSPSLLKMDLCSVEKPSSSLHQKGRKYLVLCTHHIKASPKHSCLPVVVFSGLASARPLRKLFGSVKHAWDFRPRMPLHHSHQHLHLHVPTDMCIRHFHMDGMEYLYLADFYSKIILVHYLPAGQSNSAKVIHILEEWFCDHDTSGVLCTENDPQYASAAFADCSTEWGFTQETSSPHYPESNGFMESCVKIVKHTLQHAKYSGTNPRIALQQLKATPVDAKCPSPSQILYNHKIHTTTPSRICNTDPAALQVQDHLEDWAELAKSYADKCSNQLAPFYAGQPIATFDTQRKIWIPTTVVCVLPKNGYQICTANWTNNHHTRCHLWECSVRCNDAEPEDPSETPEQAHTRFPRPVPQPAIATQWTPQSVAPVTPEPSLAVSVSAPTTMPKVTPVPTPSSTLSVAPVQPQRWSHAHTAPRHLTTEM